jgi:hypothetical protein
MQFSLHYRRVRAVFDPPAAVKLNPALAGTVRSTFQVGPVTYGVSFILEEEGVYYLAFGLKHISGSPEELSVYFSRLLKRHVGPEETEILKYDFKDASTKTLGVGNAGQVFGNVLAIMQKFIDKYEPKEIYFSAEDDRVSLYYKMLKRYLPPKQIKIQPISFATFFHILFYQ